MEAIVYASHAKEPFDRDSLVALVQKSAAANASYGVTGFLYYQDQRFLQYIEGERSAVEELLTRIKSDSRHDVDAVLRRSITDRQFPGWDMQRYVMSNFSVEYDGLTLEKLLSDYFQHAANRGTPPKTERVWRLIDAISESVKLANERTS